MKLRLINQKRLILAILSAKILYLFLSVNVISQYTQLGDTERYLSAQQLDLQLNSTAVMDSIGYLTSGLPSGLKHLPMLFLSFSGLVYLIKVMGQTNIIKTSNDRLIIFIFFAIPSFGIWSSIHSKEAVGVLYMSIIAAFIIRVNIQKIIFPNFLEALALFLCALFKPQYLISIITVYVFVVVIRQCKLSVGLQILIFLLCVSFQTTFLYILQPTIDGLAVQMHGHFDSQTAMSTRENLLVEPGDFFKYLLFGMFISFYGPLLSEISNSYIKLLTFIESLFLVISMLYVFFLAVLKSFPKFTPVNFFIVFLSFFWLLFVHYPFGFFNPGAAIRYRTGFLPFLYAMLMMYLNHKNTFHSSQYGGFKTRLRFEKNNGNDFE